jgi:mono/diheme cytochrome c family protein
MTIGRSQQRILWLAVLAGACSIAAAQQTAQRLDIGKREFDNNCAVCHGRDAKGAGPYADLLKRSPPDLTTMSRRNAGVFPLSQAYDVIEGAGPGHGGRDMPIWGQDYSIKAAEYYIDMPYDSQAYVRSRILALAEYLSRLQAK